jgi:hypothetical protein
VDKTRLREQLLRLRQHANRHPGRASVTLRDAGEGASQRQQDSG